MLKNIGGFLHPHSKYLTLLNKYSICVYTILYAAYDPTKVLLEFK